MPRHLLLASAAIALLGGGASAADLPIRGVAPPVVAPVFTWTGFYLGVNAGYASSENRAIETRGNNGPGAGPLIGPANTDTVANVTGNRRPRTLASEQEGFTGGGTIGYNYQFTQGHGIVVGVEADASYTDLQRAQTFVSTMNDPSTFRQSLDFLGTVRGRLGYAIGPFLAYGTGGFAYGTVAYGADFFGNAASRPLAYSGRANRMETGYVYGGGVEYAIPTDSFLNVFQASAVTIKAEYLRYELGNREVIVGQTNLAPVTGSYTSRFDTTGAVARVGLNYKFGSH